MLEAHIRGILGALALVLTVAQLWEGYKWRHTPMMRNTMWAWLPASAIYAWFWFDLAVIGVTVQPTLSVAAWLSRFAFLAYAGAAWFQILVWWRARRELS